MLGDTVRVRGLGSWLVSGRVRVRIGVRVRVRLRLWGKGYLGMASNMQKQVSHCPPKTVHYPTKSVLL